MEKNKKGKEKEKEQYRVNKCRQTKNVVLKLGIANYRFLLVRYGDRVKILTCDSHDSTHDIYKYSTFIISI